MVCSCMFVGCSVVCCCKMDELGKFPAEMQMQCFKYNKYSLFYLAKSLQFSHTIAISGSAIALSGSAIALPM